MSERLRRARSAWRFRGQTRPEFALDPGPGQESVWDYPRPPTLVTEPRPVRVEREGAVVASSTRALRCLETASPPTVYVPAQDVHFDRLVPAAGSSHCEWKGVAHYWALAIDGPTGTDGASGPVVGWSYPEPYEEFEALRDHLSFYPARVSCWLGEERVKPQPGRFYGGWITSELVGPFKGEPGSEGW